jgi:hypothetical protein
MAIDLTNKTHTVTVSRTASATVTDGYSGTTSIACSCGWTATASHLMTPAEQAATIDDHEGAVVAALVGFSFTVTVS